MIFGRLSVDDRAVSTHRDSYLLSELTVVSVRRPFLPPVMLLAGGGIGFIAAFSDLLYFSEIVFCLGMSAGLVLIGTQLAQLSLLSRDLRGSELTSAVWGFRSSLEAKRHEIVATLRRSTERGAP
jgi:hypothetical protein